MLWWTISKTRYDKYATGIGWFPSFRIQQNLNDCQWWRDCRLQLFSVGKSNASCIEWCVQQQYFSFLTKTHSGTLIQFLFWNTKKKCGSVIDSTMSLSEESDIWCVLQLKLEILGQNWNKFDVSKIVFTFRKTLIWIQNSDISGILCCIKESDIIDLISCNKTLTEFEGVGWKSLSQWMVAVPFWT